MQEKSYKLHWDRWQMSLMSENRIFAINMFDRTFILDGDRLMMPSFNETSGTYVTLYEVAQIGEYAVKFVTVRIILDHDKLNNRQYRGRSTIVISSNNLDPRVKRVQLSCRFVMINYRASCGGTASTCCCATGQICVAFTRGRRIPR